jgi:hypothetical protein
MKSLRMTYQPTRAPEIFGDHWFNTDPISIRDLHGRPVVLFFCDRTSPQSQGLVPLFNGMHTLYYEYGLTCIGIHVPEFSFGKNPVKVEQWIHKNIILFPVVTDNERPIANAYRISAVPSICLIDNKGDIYDTIASNFIPERIERSVQYLLRQSGYRGELPILINPAFDRGYLLTGDMISEIRKDTVRNCRRSTGIRNSQCTENFMLTVSGGPNGIRSSMKGITTRDICCARRTAMNFVCWPAPTTKRP